MTYFTRKPKFFTLLPLKSKTWMIAVSKHLFENVLDKKIKSATYDRSQNAKRVMNLDFLVMYNAWTKLVFLISYA